MSHSKHFRLVDDVSDHFDTVVSSANVFLQSRYVGFYAVAAAAVLELALKEIVVGFARSHHAMFGDYVAVQYEKINGRIAVDHIVKEHLKPFGRAYQSTFKEQLKSCDEQSIRENKFSIKHSYEALLVCRHQFAHAGSVPETSTYAEIKTGFGAGRLVMQCLSDAMQACQEQPASVQASTSRQDA